MFYTADLHIHSHYSRATSRNLNLESLYQWARIKGVNVVGTGDFTHPYWFKELKEKLEPDGTGLFKLKDPPKEPAIAGLKVHDIDVRFCLSSEISSIYKYGDKVRKNHNLLYAPDFDTVARINAKLDEIGNLQADGRPILGLPARDLLDITLNTSERAYLIPAHVWTPWFSMFGSKSGYDSVKECFRDLTDHIFALETGLSSDPEMNWRLSALDKYTLISNSDAHSPQKLGREANLFDTERSYDGLFDAIKTRKGFLGTYEFFPEEGKYHLDGHRKCGVCLEPEETLKHNGLCPSCGKPLTVGVLHRVEKLSDRKQPQRPKDAADFHYIIPLPEIIAQIQGVGPNSKAVQHAFQQVISAFGNEFNLLKRVPLEDIEGECGPILAEAVRRMRMQQVKPQAGYDGQFGVIRIFNEGEVDALFGQMHIFGSDSIVTMKKRQAKRQRVFKDAVTTKSESRERPAAKLNPAQLNVQQANQGAVLVKAGPGTGKTHTLIEWLAARIQSGVKPEHVMAVTFTNKAADELRDRLIQKIGDKVRHMTIGTFHAIAYRLLQEAHQDLNTVYDEQHRHVVSSMLFGDLGKGKLATLTQALGRTFELGNDAGYEDIDQYVKQYREELHRQDAIDLADIINQLVSLWREQPRWLERHREQFHVIAIDEFQDLNLIQYQFVKLLGKDKNLLAIGDPDQAIYGFRGADVRHFFQFQHNFGAEVISLSDNYRSTGVVLDAAHNLIQHNTQKNAIKLTPHQSRGELIQYYSAAKPGREADYIVAAIENYVGGTSHLALESIKDKHKAEYTFADVAVLFRTRAIGRALVKRFRQSNIPVQFGDNTPVLSKPPFSIIADVLRLYIKSQDMVSLDNFLMRALNWSAKDRQKILHAVHSANMDWRDLDPNQFNQSAAAAFRNWVLFYRALSEVLQRSGVIGAVQAILENYLPDEKLNYSQILTKDAILQLAEEAQADVEQFIAQLTLDSYTDIGRFKADRVRLLTFHAAKGLEFPIVFITGAEEGIAPITKDDADLEEERRLFYVAMTRAKDALHITRSKERSLYGETRLTQPSRFIQELPSDLLETVAEQVSKQNPDTEQLSFF